MPTYEYECLACKKRFERFQKFTDPAITECPECGKAVRKVLFPAGIVFKGSGWYKTEGRPSSENGSSDSAPVVASEKKSDTKSDSKPATKTETKADAKSEASGSKSESASSKTASSKSAASKTAPAKA